MDTIATYLEMSRTQSRSCLAITDNFTTTAGDTSSYIRARRVVRARPRATPWSYRTTRSLCGAGAGGERLEEIGRRRA